MLTVGPHHVVKVRGAILGGALEVIDLVPLLSEPAFKTGQLAITEARMGRPAGSAFARRSAKRGSS